MPSANPTPQVETTRQARPTEGPLYRVIIHNDDITPMEFVLHILTGVFELAGPRAVQVMYTAHYHGSAYVVSLPRPEALRRVGLAQASARLSGFPLKFTLEPEASTT